MISLKDYKVSKNSFKNYSLIVKLLDKQKITNYTSIYLFEDIKQKDLNLDFSKLKNYSLIVFNNLKDVNIIEESDFSNKTHLNFYYIFRNSKNINYLKSFKSNLNLKNNIQTIVYNSKINFSNLFFDSNNLNYNQKTYLYYKNTEYNQNDLVFLNKSQKNIINQEIIHASKNTVSNTTSRNILKGSSFLKYDGLINILKNSEKVEAFLQTNTMLLSKSAKSINIPMLEIIPNNVKASHSATNEYISYEKLFYLESRGLSKASSKRLLISSFLKSFINFYPNNLIEYISKKINDKL